MKTKGTSRSCEGCAIKRGGKMTGIPLIIAFVIAIALMIVAISKWHIHPFLSIMCVSVLLALVAGIPIATIPTVVGQGFSGTFTSIGIVIILGALVGIDAHGVSVVNLVPIVTGAHETTESIGAAAILAQVVHF